MRPTITVRDFESSPTLEDLLERPLWGGPPSRSRGFVQRARRMLDIVEREQLIRGRAAMGMFPVTERDAYGIRLGETGRISIQLTAETILRCTDVVLIVATIGPECETRASLLVQRGERLKGLLLDVIGTIAVERLLDRTREAIGEMACDAALDVGPIISPGMKRLSLDQQVVIQSMVEADRIGVQASPVGMLWPVKSSSMVVTLGHDMPDCGELHPCAQCESYYVCQFRRYQHA